MIVFLDLDGVLADFVGGVHEAFNLSYSYAEYPYSKGLWDWFAEAGLTWDRVDSACNAEFWANLKWIIGGRDIYNTAKKYSRQSGNSLNLLTTPMKNINSTVGKLTWIQQHLGENRRKQALITGAKKEIFAGPDTLLIDDWDRNVEEFRKAGGQAILVPRPWNKDSHLASQSAKTVKKLLENLQCQAS